MIDFIARALPLHRRCRGFPCTSRRCPRHRIRAGVHKSDMIGPLGRRRRGQRRRRVLFFYFHFPSRIFRRRSIVDRVRVERFTCPKGPSGRLQLLGDKIRETLHFSVPPSFRYLYGQLSTVVREDDNVQRPRFLSARFHRDRCNCERKLARARWSVVSLGKVCRYLKDV